MSDLPEPSDFRHRTDVEIRFRDLDAMGHVNNAVYFTYFEVARTGYARALGLVPAAGADPAVAFPFILAGISCRFLSPAVFGESLGVHVRCVRIGRRSYELEYLATEAASGRAVAFGRSAQVQYDYAAGKTCPVPESFRSAVERLEGRVFPAPP